MSLNVSAAPPPSPTAPRWQSTLTAVALAVLSILVAFPIAVSVLLVLAAVLTIAGAGTLTALGALEMSSLVYGALITAILLGAAVIISAGRALGSLLRLLRTRVPGGLPPKPGSSWILRHPWWAAFTVAFFIDGCVAPLEAAHFVSLPGAVVAAGVLTGASLLLLFTVYASVRLWWFGVRALGMVARRSSFVAGVVTTGSLFVAFVAFFLGRALTHNAEALAELAPGGSAPVCTGAPLDCVRSAFAPASPAAPLGQAAAALPSPEPKDEFDDCVKELHRDDAQRGNAYRDAINEAQRRLRDPEEAVDVVHDTLITVCLGSGRLVDVRAYFVRSVRNNAGRVARRNRRFCPLVPEGPDWPAEQCVARSAEQLSIQRDMEAAMHDALCSLDRADRTVIHLHAVDNLSHREIGRQLGWSEAAARQRYSRATGRLRAEFDLRCR